MELNININLNATPAMQELVKTVCEAYTIKKAAQLAAKIIREREGIVAPDDEEPESPADDEVKEQSQQAPAAEAHASGDSAEEQTPKRKRRSKKEMQMEAPATEEEAFNMRGDKPVNEETSAAPEDLAPKALAPEASAEAQAQAEAQSDLPFAKETGEDEAPRTEMSIDAFRVKLDQIRDRLGVNEGQPNFEHKNAFTRFARDLMVYYGGTRSEQLTPANLFWYAVQLSSTKLENGGFTCKEPSITTEQVKEYSEAPY